MEAITKYRSDALSLVLSRSCWRLNLDSSYHYPLPGIYFSTNLSPKKLCLMKASTSPKEENKSTDRPFIPFPPTQWGDHFLSASVNLTEIEDLRREIEALKPRVNAMLLPSSGADAKQIISLIHTLVSLGVSYHFEKEIVEFLNDAFENVQDMIIDCEADDLYTVSVMFRVFRSYGHNMSSGMLSFYEATHFGTTTEDILDEAMSFTQKYLELFVTGVEAIRHPHISKLITNTLYLPQKDNLDLLFAREYFKFYENETDHDETVLKLAKLNFKFLQLHYIQELKTLTAWRTKLDLESKIPNYFRERLVETYFWTTGICYEPQYSAVRLILTKAIVLLDVLDTTFDAYGSLSEVQTLVQCIERCAPGLKVVFRIMLDAYKRVEKNVRSEGRSFTLVYTYEMLKVTMEAYLQEAKWASARHVPSYEEYMEVGVWSTAGEGVLAITFIGMGEIAGEDTYKWVTSRPNLIRFLCTKSRLRDDISTFKDEMSRGDIANGFNCYIKQYGVTEEEASLEFEKRINHMSKLMNEEFLKTATFLPLQILRPIMNYGRLADLSYKYGDEYTYAGEKTKDYITSLFVDLITN